MAEPKNLTGVLDHLDDEAHDTEITVGDVLASIGGRGYGPILVGLALIEILPTGAIPGVPTLVAVLVVLIAGQMVFGRAHPWIPKKLANKSFDREKLKKTRAKLRRVTKRIDAVLRSRLEIFTGSKSAKIVGFLCLALACLMPPLELIPFASSGPATAIALFGLGLTARDGLLVLSGFILSAASAVGAVYWLM